MPSKKKYSHKRVVRRSNTADSITIGEAYNEFINQKEVEGLAPKTINNYKQAMMYFLQYSGLTEDDEVSNITTALMYSWIEKMKQGAMKVVSINTFVRNFRVFLNWCQDPSREYIKERMQIKLMRQQEDPLKMFSEDELTELLDKPRRNASFGEWRMWAIVNWILATGNRGATVCEVQNQDVNLSKREIALRHTKNKKTQVIPMSSSLYNVMQEYIRMWKQHDTNMPDDYLFSNVSGEMLTTNALHSSFKRYCMSRGVNHWNIHGLRHNFAKGWVQSGGNVFALQKILGHQTLTMTQRYVKLFAEDINDGYDNYSLLDNLKKPSRRKRVVSRNDN